MSTAFPAAGNLDGLRATRGKGLNRPCEASPDVRAAVGPREMSTQSSSSEFRESGSQGVRASSLSASVAFDSSPMRVDTSSPWALKKSVVG